MITPQLFVEYLAQIKEWNATARDVHKENAEEIYNNQTAFVEEEILETIASYEQNNIKEILDGAADVLVTLGYKVSLLNIAIGYDFYLENIETILDTEYHDYKFNGSVAYLLKELKEINEAKVNFKDLVLGTNYLQFDVKIAENVYKMLASIENYTNKSLVPVIEDVLESNWSKYPFYKSEEVCEYELNFIKNNRKGVESVTYTVRNDRVIYFNQNNKIMKPSTFQDVNPTKWGL